MNDFDPLEYLPEQTDATGDDPKNDSPDPITPEDIGARRIAAPKDPEVPEKDTFDALAILDKEREPAPVEPSFEIEADDQEDLALKILGSEDMRGSKLPSPTEYTPLVNPEMLGAVAREDPQDISQDTTAALSKAMQKYGITTPRRRAHFLSQIAHESFGFTHTEEMASGEDYEGREDLGNTEPGDGKRFKGRGYIQLTGRANYEAYSRYSGIPMEELPERLANDPEVAADAAGWYWDQRNLNEKADQDDFVGITKGINGGTNGIEDRRQRLKAALSHIEGGESLAGPGTGSKSVEKIREEVKRELGAMTYRGDMFSREDPDEFAPYMASIDPTKDIRHVRARNQSNWEQMRRSLVRTPTKAVLGVIEGAGILLDVPAVVNTLQGEGDDFNNWLTELARSGKEGIDESFAVYREDPNAVWDPSDFAWWVQNGEGLIASLASFYAVGAGVGLTASKVASTLSTMMNAGATANKVLQAGSALTTAASLAYTEGAMEAADVYTNLYDEAIADGKSEDDAKRIAGLGAAKTVTTNSLVNTGLNATGAMAFLRPLRGVRALKKAGLARRSTESFAAYANRLKTDPKTRTYLQSVLKEVGREAPQEALEEVVNEISRAEGMFKGHQLAGKEDNRKVGERIVDTAWSPEAALGAVLGAIGGGGQAIAMQFAPRRALKQGDGENKPGAYKGWTTSGMQRRAALEAASKQRRQEMISMVEGHLDAREELEKAATEGDEQGYQNALRRMFGLVSAERITSGMEEQMLEAYREIAEMSEEEAMAAGFDTEPTSDNYYKKLAQDKINETEELAKVWKDTQARYNFDNDEHLAGLPRFVFDMEIQKRHARKGVEAAEKEEQNLRELMKDNSDLEGTDLSFDEMMEVSKEAIAAEEEARLIQEEIDRIEGLSEDVKKDDEMADSYSFVDGDPSSNMESRARLSDLREKYQGEDSSKLIEDLKSRRQKALTRMKEANNRVQEVVEQLAEDTGDVEQANKRFDEWVERNQTIDEQLTEAANKKARLRADQQTAEATLTRISNKKGRKSYRDAFQKEIKRLKKVAEDRILDVMESAATEDQVDDLASRAEDSEKVQAAAEKKKSKIKNQKAKDKREERQYLDDLSAQEGPSEEVVLDKDEVDPEQAEHIFKEVAIQDTLEDARKAFQFFLENFQMPENLVDRIKNYLNNFDEHQEELAAEDAADTQDEADTPVEHENTNAASTKDELAEQIRNLQKDENGHEMTASGERMLYGDKVVHGAVALAYLAQDYQYVEVDGVRRPVTVSDKINEEAHYDVLSPHGLQVGDPITLQVDPNYEGVDDSGETITYEDIVEGHDGEEWEVAPIKVMNSKGETIAYIHDVSWIDESSDSNPNVAKNVATVVGEEGYDNWGRQKALIRKVRQEIWSRGGDPVQTSVADRAVGHLTKNLAYTDDGEVDINNREPVYRSLRDSGIGDDVEVYVVRGGRREIGREEAFPHPLVNVEEELPPEGSVGLMLPTPTMSNGNIRYMAVPVWIPQAGPKIGGDMYEAMKAWHTSTPEAKAIEAALPVSFNQEVKDSLSNVLEEFYLSSSFDRDDTRNTKTSSSKIHFHVSEKTGQVDIARHGGAIYTTSIKKSERKGYRYMFETDADGGFKYEDTVRELFESKLLNVDMDRMNTQNEKFLWLWKNNDGNWEGGHQRYRDVLFTDIAQTDVAGTQIEAPDGSTETVYFLQGPIIYSTDFIEDTPIATEDPQAEMAKERADALAAQEEEEGVEGPAASDMQAEVWGASESQKTATKEESGPDLENNPYYRKPEDREDEDIGLFTFVEGTKRLDTSHSESSLAAKSDQLLRDGVAQITCKT